MRLDLGARPGAFVVHAIRLDGTAIEALASHIVAGSPARPMERDDTGLRIASTRENPWLEIDVRGLLAHAETSSVECVEVELERESGAAELAALITCAVGEALDARPSSTNPTH
jgi:hypothetical protein